MSNINTRHVLNEEDKQLIEKIKASLSSSITALKASGVRSTNIEIELMKHIKKELYSEE